MIQYIRPQKQLKQLKSSSSHFESLFFMICFQKWAQSGTSLTSLRRNRPIQSLNPCKFASISSSNGTKAMPTTSQIPRWQVGWNTLPPIMVQSKMGVSPIGSLPFKYCAIFHFQLWGKEEVYTNPLEENHQNPATFLRGYVGSLEEVTQTRLVLLYTHLLVDGIYEWN